MSFERQYTRHLICGPVTAFIFIYFIWLAGVGREDLSKVKWWGPLGLFLVLDAAFNIIIGSFIYWELPKISLAPWEWGRGEWLFTDRLIRHKAAGNELACILCKLLSKYDPGHC